jgi:uncharacterized protein with HEPN domain
LFDALLIADMIEACEAILTYTHGLKRSEILANKEKLHALYFNFQILGEAANKLSENTKLSDDTIPWRKLTAMRNRLVHDYAGIDDIILLELVESEIPNLLQKLKYIS